MYLRNKKHEAKNLQRHVRLVLLVPNNGQGRKYMAK